jgi:hypothetical protein
LLNTTFGSYKLNIQKQNKTQVTIHHLLRLLITEIEGVNHGVEVIAYHGYVGLLESFDLSGRTPKTDHGISSYDHFFLPHFSSPFSPEFSFFLFLFFVLVNKDKDADFC